MELLKIGGNCGLPIGSYRYVGMGANRFYDFLLVHRYLGITNMISLERDSMMYKRATYNVPFGFIDVQEKSSADFLARDASDVATIYWLDYDSGIGIDVLSDITSLSTRIEPGHFCFVTVCGEPPAVIADKSDEERLAWLQDNLRGTAGDVTREDVERASFFQAVHKIAMASFRSAFAPRTEGVFVPALQARYSDSVPMVTVGGAFLTRCEAVAYREQVKAAMPFLNTTDTKIYKIASLNLTDRERALFDRAVTSKTTRSRERSVLGRLGFKASEINAYGELMRYVPRYVEAIV